MQGAILQVIRLGCARQQKLIFRDIAFDLTSGETLMITGPNGSGKSSLLRLLASLSTPWEGEIIWNKASIQQSRYEYIANLHYIGHTNGIKSNLTILENLRFFAQLACSKTETQTELQDRLSAVLQRLALAQVATIPAKYVSAGEQRRIALARLFLVPKRIWILDEPLTALDLKTQAVFLAQLKTHLHNGGIAIISSHHPLSLHHVNVKTLGLPTC